MISSTKITAEAREILGKSMMTKGMTDQEIQEFIEASDVRVVSYGKGDVVFHDGDTPRSLHILLSGAVHILKDTFLGRRIFIAEINTPGDMFGEVYEVLGKPYDVYVESVAPTTLLEIASPLFLLDTVATPSRSAILVQRNLLRMFAGKAYALITKLRVLASGSLREKIVRYLLPSLDEDGSVTLTVSREYIAAYLAVSRPSLSRELSAMQREGIIAIAGKRIQVIDMERFEEYL